MLQTSWPQLHNKVELQSEELNEYDFVQDYGELKKIKKHIDDNLITAI